MNKIGIYAAGLLALSQHTAFAANLPTTFPSQSLQQNASEFALSGSGFSNSSPNDNDLGIQFDLSNSDPILTQVPTQAPTEIDSQSRFPTSNFAIQPPAPSSLKPSFNLLQQATFTLRQLFSNDTDSLVAVAVGSAEGTRTADGDRNTHFYGHSDPGNGVWNLGTFSYQHGAGSAEEADAKQLERLKRQAQVMQEKAADRGLKLTLEETLNGIDLANQAPEALLDVAGYIDWLEQAHRLGMTGPDAILWARVQSFIDPKTQRWNAPGLGNTAESITHDQQRRVEAIARAIARQNHAITADARLKPQPIGFRLPQWNLAQRLIHQVSSWLNWA